MRLMIMLSGFAMGGAERNIVSLLPHIRDIAGVTPIIGTLNTWRDSPLVETFEETGVRRIDLNARKLIDPPAWRRFLRMLREEEIDVISTQDQYTNIFGALAHWRSDVPVVMTRHVMVEPDETYREALKAKLMLRAARWGADHVIAVSEAVRQHFSKQAGVPLSRIDTIYNGLDVARFETWGQRAEMRAKLGWGADEKIAIMVAVLRRGKGHEVLFEAVPALQHATPGVKIKLVGDGELNDTLRAQASDLADSVEFMGQRTDVPDLLGASDVLLLPSWTEALPTVLIEAGAARLPVVATDVGGTREIVADGETGYVIEPGDARALADRTIAVLSDGARAKDMGAKAHAHVLKTFSLQRQAEETVALMERVRSRA